ncbi:sn-glycerol-3-phosphate import ATP-binding protein UgpC [Fodinicurvata sediminis]|uniref:sn-glycerol-3-phosphate import ATP-binding protein UgpC n=1 Tax=Fodinicurvata sediminis TaxID=1121832 RepID=UPI0003B3DDC0|nr:sn-glycerol-3-phosphate import ATP-binding protein UgpC [Fodinicurvata sediminis]
MAELRLDNVIKEFGEVRVIHGVDLKVQDGEFVVVVGPSGCGKSTLLRMVAGLEEVSGGEIHIDERMVNRVEPKDRDIAIVFQNYALYPHMSVRQNMAYGLKIRKFPKPEIEQRVKDAADLLQLGEYLDRRPNQLSGGQRQRVAMGRAIVREPSIFLFDEPLSNLDAKLRVQMRVEIRQLQRRLGTTSLYVTHDQVEAMTMADRLVVMNGGVAEQVGTPLEIYERPASIFVAGFIGSPSMNFVEGRISSDRQSVVIGQDFSIPLPQVTEAAQADRPVTVGLRPEDLHLTQESPDEASLPLTVELIEVLGADTLLHGQAPHIENPIIARLSGVPEVDNGQVVHLAFRPRKLHLFDRDSGKSLLNEQQAA